MSEIEKETVFLSVIIPTCNRLDLLSNCLKCLSPGKQTLNSDLYEVIVSDDGKNISAEAMIREEFPWAYWIKGPSRGPASNRNNGASIAKGKWLVFTDDDCLPDPGWLGAYYDSIQEGIYIYEGKTISRENMAASPLVLSPVNTMGGYLFSCNFMIKKEIFKSLKGFDETFLMPHLEDTDLHKKIKKEGYQCKFIPEALIDHPPRRVSSGIARGISHKYDIYFFKKWENGITKFQMIKTIVLIRLRTIKNFPLSKDSFIAFYSMFEELFIVMREFSKWKKEYE